MYNIKNMKKLTQVKFSLFIINLMKRKIYKWSHERFIMAMSEKLSLIIFFLIEILFFWFLNVERKFSAILVVNEKRITVKRTWISHGDIWTTRLWISSGIWRRCQKLSTLKTNSKGKSTWSTHVQCTSTRFCHRTISRQSSWSEISQSSYSF